MVQVGRRSGQARRQPVRDRDRQGLDGRALDHDRRACRNPRRRRRGGPGRRHRGGDRRCSGTKKRRREGKAEPSARRAPSPQPKSDTSDFGRSIKRPNSDRSEFGWGEGWGEGVPAPRSIGNPLTPALSPSGERESGRAGGHFEARPVLRGAHAGAQLRPGAACRRRRGHAACPAACERGRDRLGAPQRVRAARPHRRPRYRIRAR